MNKRLIVVIILHDSFCLLQFIWFGMAQTASCFPAAQDSAKKPQPKQRKDVCMLGLRDMALMTLSARRIRLGFLRLRRRQRFRGVLLWIETQQ